MTVPVEFAGVSGILSVSGISRKWCGMAKPLTLGEVARRSRDGEGKDAAKEPDTQRYAPCLSEPSYRNAAGVISPGLPSQALARQLSQRESPWQRGLVFDETDLRLLENVTECQSLSYQERWHRAKRRCRRGCTEQHLRYSAHAKGVLCPTSQSRIRSTALLVGEPLAKRFRFR